MMKTKKPKFLRRTWSRYSKLGKGRKKKQKWRRPTGRDNKMREKRKGYPVVVSVGYAKGELNKKKFIIVNNLKELEKVGKNQEIILGKLGKKKKLEIAKLAKEKKIEIYNMNPKSFLKKNEKKKPKKIEDKKPEEKKETSKEKKEEKK